ncbi:MAG: ABC transporter permease [Cyanobacteria bacterium P01_E01_bin.42]
MNNARKVSGKWLEIFALLAPGGFWLLFLLVFPTLIIFELSLVPDIHPGEVVDPRGLANYWSIFNPIHLRVLGRSLLFATEVAFLSLILGFPVAYGLGRLAPKRWRNLLLLMFVLPLWTSSLLRTYAWIAILRPTGLFNTILTTLGLPSLDILNSPIAVIIGMTYNYLPYMVLILYASVEKLDTNVLEAAADLGATPLQTFWKITIPQTRSGIVAGSLLVFISALGDFIDPELLGGASSMTASRLIYNQFLGITRNWGFGSALSMVLMFVTSVAIALFLRYGNRQGDRD